jgi:hypothetical protein
VKALDPQAETGDPSLQGGGEEVPVRRFRIGLDGDLQGPFPGQKRAKPLKEPGYALSPQNRRGAASDIYGWYIPDTVTAQQGFRIGKNFIDIAIKPEIFLAYREGIKIAIITAA